MSGGPVTRVRTLRCRVEGSQYRSALVSRVSLLEFVEERNKGIVDRSLRGGANEVTASDSVEQLRACQPHRADPPHRPRTRISMSSATGRAGRTSTTRSNLAASCQECNARRGAAVAHSYLAWRNSNVGPPGDPAALALEPRSSSAGAGPRPAPPEGADWPLVRQPLDRDVETTTASTTVRYTRDALDRIVARAVNGTTAARYGYARAGNSADFVIDTTGVVAERRIVLLGGAS